MNRTYWATVLGVALMCLSSALAGANSEITVDLPGGAKMEFVWIEPGTFAMGLPSSEPEWSITDGPQHQVTITKGFYLGKYEITQGQWQAVMGTTPWLGQSYVQSNPSNPAGYICWQDVQEFIHRLNQAAGDSLYRLPTEAEWEDACRAGTQTRWSLGDDGSQLGDYAWYDANASKVQLVWAQSVGQKKPNPWGLYDMHGNVWEWVQDWYGEYPNTAQVDPKGLAAGGTSRVMRGGSFGSLAHFTRSAMRYYYAPGYRYGSFGARLVRTK